MTKEGVIIEVFLLRGNTEHALHAAQIGNDLPLNLLAGVLYALAGDEAVVPVHQLLSARLKGRVVLVGPPVGLLAVLVILRAHVVEGVGDLMAYDHTDADQSSGTSGYATCTHRASSFSMAAVRVCSLSQPSDSSMTR